MNKIQHNHAFTLVELIVVITILAVLATVAFISFQGYGQSSRDSVRLADIKSAEKVINLYRLTNSRYPTPNDETGITYSGSTAWIQGTFGQNAYTSNTSLSNVPTDPLTGLPYAYSVTNTKQEYQMAAVLEGEVANFNNQSYAGNQIASAYVRGDYNGQFIKVSANSTNYLLGVPSIIASDITSVDMMDIINNQRLVYKGYNNLPASFSGSQYDNNGGFAFTPNRVILFEGDTSDLETDPAQRVTFLDNLQTNYGGTVIAAEEDIAEILSVDSISNEGQNLIINILNNSLKTNISHIQNTIISCIDGDIENAKVGAVSGFQPNCLLADNGCNEGYIKYNNSCILPGGIGVSSTSLTFSDPVGSTVYGDTQTITIENIGEAIYSVPLPILDNTTNFQIITNTCTTLSGGSTCTFSVERKASTGGNKTGSITIDDKIITLSFDATGYTLDYTGSSHSPGDCIAEGGVVTTISGDSNGNQLCKFTQTTCPSGWIQAGNWKETSTRTCNGRTIPTPTPPSSSSITLVESYDCPSNNTTTGCTVNGRNFSKGGLDYCHYSQYFSDSSWSYRSDTYFDTLDEAKNNDSQDASCNSHTPSLSFSCYHYQPYNQKNRAYGYVYNSVNNKYARVYWIAQSTNYNQCTSNYRRCEATITSIGCK